MGTREGRNGLMSSTVIRKYSETPRVGLRDRCGGRAIESCGKSIREFYEYLISPRPVLSQSWSPRADDFGRAVVPPPSTSGSRRASTVAKPYYDSGAPALERTVDRCAASVERAAARVLAFRRRAAQCGELTPIVITVALPALLFVCFALARWAGADDPSAAAWTDEASQGRSVASGRVYMAGDPQLLISATLVEPPTQDGRVLATPPITPTAWRQAGGHQQTGDATARRPRPNGLAALPMAVGAGQNHWRQPRPASADPEIHRSFPDNGQSVHTAGPIRAAPLPRPRPEPPAASANPHDTPAAAYPFTPRPRPTGHTESAAHSPPEYVAPDRGTSPAAGRTPGPAYMVQLAAVGGRDQALDLWKSLSQKHPDLLGTLKPDISPQTTRQGSRVYRLRTGSLSGKPEADRLCASLEVQKMDCLVVKVSG